MTCIFKGNELVVANVGDSRIILGRKGRDGKIESKALSRDHKPDVPEEAERIKMSNGRIGPFMYYGEAVGPPRVWLQDEDMPGLCMTRAFGYANLLY